MKHVAYHVILLVPLLLAVVWLSALVGPQQAGFAQLSPARSEALITGLTIFIIGYVIFLGLIYSEELKRFIHRARHLRAE